MIDFKVARDIDGNIMHDLINKTFRIKESIPHEWYFLNILTREEIKKNKDIADAFVMFVLQYYPNYQWDYFKQDDSLATTICECELKAFQFQKKYEFKFNLDAREEDHLTKSIMLGDIVTDFLIRYRNYSLIKCSGQNIILTAQSNCDKRFEKYLAQGYSLQRRAKVGFIKKPITSGSDSYHEIKGFFSKLPVLPTKDIGYPIDEIIEDSNGEYKSVIQLTKKLR